MSQDKKKGYARVYLTDGPTLRLHDVIDAQGQLRQLDGVISGIDASSGDRVSIRSVRVTSIAVPQETPEPGIMWGRKIELRAASAFWHDGSRMTPAELAGSDEGVVMDVTRDMGDARRAEVVALVAEDLASAVVVVYDLGADEVLWANPASSPDAIEYAVQAIKLLALSEAVEQRFQEESIAESPQGEEEGRPAPVTARQFLLNEGIGEDPLIDQELVERTGLSGPDRVTLRTLHAGLVDGTFGWRDAILDAPLASALS